MIRHLLENANLKLALSEKDYKTIYRFLTFLLYKSDGSRTKFARKYAVKGFEDFYAIFKDLKQKLKNDREGLAFGIMKDMAKTYVGRIWANMPGETPQQKVFNAWSHTLDVIALILDNLAVLKEALKRMQQDYDAGVKA